MTDPLAAGSALAALGATFMSTALLLLLNPRDAGLRWYALFWTSIMGWLAAQGWGASTGDWSVARPVLDASLHFAPGLFMAFALVAGLRKPAGIGLVPVAVAALLYPLDTTYEGRPWADAMIWAWNVIPWIAATIVMWASSFREIREDPGRRRLARWVLAPLYLALPFAILGSAFSERGFGLYVMPLLMIWIQLFVFAGVAYLRFYDIEVRAARTGELASRAAEGERLAVLGELTASLAHEIRNPLTGVRSLAQRLAEEEIDDARRRRYAGVILEEAGRVERLVSNLLGVARRNPRTAAASLTPLDPLFEDLLLLVTARADRVGVRLAADGGRLTARAPRETLAQLLLNLLLNGVAHSPHGGSVALVAREAAGTVEIRVRDAGPGVAREERERIWEPFYSGTGGTGLGLAVVRRLAREEGWTAEVGDAPGGGAEFVLRVPAAAPARDAERSTQAAGAARG
ncbi:MAG TPA: HAMP domain-containing sensor histidine kinase [Longimicrobiaceae bacterium]|nr:HAMP domain-containing sensor histidine kinase [Longimicrobiaceae bacterium]